MPLAPNAVQGAVSERGAQNRPRAAGKPLRHKRSQSDVLHTSAPGDSCARKPTAPPESAQALPASFRLTREEKSFFARVQKDHEALMSHWDGLWNVSRRRGRGSSASAPVQKARSTRSRVPPGDSRRFMHTLIRGRTALPAPNAAKGDDPKGPATSSLSPLKRNRDGLASQRVIMDSRRLYNFALDSPFLHNMLTEDRVEGKAGRKEIRAHQRKIQERESNSGAEIAASPDQGRLTSPGTNTAGVHRNSVVEEPGEDYSQDFQEAGGGGDAVGSGGGLLQLHGAAGPLQTVVEPATLRGCGAADDEDFMNGFSDTDDEDAVADVGADAIADETSGQNSGAVANDGAKNGGSDIEEKRSSLNPSISPALLNKLTVHQRSNTSVDGNLFHIPFDPSASRPAPAPLKLVNVSSTDGAQQTAGMVFNKEKMCWEPANAEAQKEEDDMMAGFDTTSEDEDDDGGEDDNNDDSDEGW